MSERDSRLLLADIQEAIEKIKRYTKNLSEEEFMKKEQTKDAVVRNFEIIGEAANRLPEPVKEQNDHIQWARIVGFRNRIVHEYFGIDYQIVWRIIDHDLDQLYEKIQTILEGE
jgi:uncharacterized protein with HEPN domain